VEAVVEDAGPLPLRSSLVGIGRVASTISILWEASFSLEGSLEAAEGRVASWATSLVMSVAFSASLDCSTSLGGDVGYKKIFGWDFLAFICLLKGSVSLGARDMDGWRVVHILYSPKGRGGLNANLVEGLVPHLEVVEYAHLRDLSVEGFLSLCHTHVVSVLLNLLLGLLGLLQFLCQDFNLAFGCGELILSLSELLALNFCLPFHPI